MPRGEDLVDLLIKHAITRRRYLENAWFYLSRIKEICRGLDESCRVIVFGSFIKGSMRPDSDIDVLIITKLAEKPLNRGRLYRIIAEEIGFDNPFEIQIITPKEYEYIYRRLIDKCKEI